MSLRCISSPEEWSCPGTRLESWEAFWRHPNSDYNHLAFPPLRADRCQTISSRLSRCHIPERMVVLIWSHSLVTPNGYLWKHGKWFCHWVTGVWLCIDDNGRPLWPWSLVMTSFDSSKVIWCHNSNNNLWSNRLLNSIIDWWSLAIYEIAPR